MDVLKPGGRWIAGSSHSIVNYIAHENFAAMINAIHKYGRHCSVTGRKIELLGDTQDPDYASAMPKQRNSK